MSDTFWGPDFDSLKQEDPEIADVLLSELDRLRSGLQLIASENFTSPAVLAALGSTLSRSRTVFSYSNLVRRRSGVGSSSVVVQLTAVPPAPPEAPAVPVPPLLELLEPPTALLPDPPVEPLWVPLLPDDPEVEPDEPFGPEPPLAAEPLEPPFDEQPATTAKTKPMLSGAHVRRMARPPEQSTSTTDNARRTHSVLIPPRRMAGNCAERGALTAILKLSAHTTEFGCVPRRSAPSRRDIRVHCHGAVAAGGTGPLRIPPEM